MKKIKLAERTLVRPINLGAENTEVLWKRGRRYFIGERSVSAEEAKSWLRAANASAELITCSPRIIGWITKVKQSVLALYIDITRLPDELEIYHGVGVDETVVSCLIGEGLEWDSSRADDHGRSNVFATFVSPDLPREQYYARLQNDLLKALGFRIDGFQPI